MIATDQANRLANYSNYGHHNADIAAPGSQILSTILHGQARLTLRRCHVCNMLTCLMKMRRICIRCLVADHPVV